MRTHASLLVLLLAFVALGTTYNATLPLFEAPDEMDHFRYIDWLASRRGLPDMVADLQEVGHEIWQPPLYYTFMAPLVSIIDTKDLYELAPVNPYWRQGAGINVHYHTEKEGFPYQGTSLAIHLVRFISTLLACLTIVSAYGIAKLIIPQHATLAAGLVAFNPMFLFISAAVNNDTLVTVFSSMTIFILVWSFYQEQIPLWVYVVMGALVGLATLSKLSGLALAGLISVGLLFSALKNKSWRPILVGLPVSLIVLFMTAGWWFIRNWVNYGDPFAWDIMQIANRGLLRAELLNLPELFNYATWLQYSYWAMFGYGGLRPNPSFYLIVNSLAFVGFIGLVIWFIRKIWGQRFQPELLAVILLLGWALATFISLLRWMSQLEATNQGRLLFPAITSIAILLILGLSIFSKKRNWPGRALVTVLAVWATISPFLLIRPGYAHPSPLSANSDLPNPVSFEFGEEITLMGYELLQGTVQVGESLIIDLYWQAQAPMEESYVIALHAVDPSGEVVSRLDTIPYNGRYATAVWQPGQPFRDSYTLPPIQEDTIPGQASILLAVYPWLRPEEALPVKVEGVEIGRDLILSNFKIPLPQDQKLIPANDVDAIFGRQARLMGFDNLGDAQPGGTFPITFYWEALEPDGNDYSVFVHLIDKSGEIISQADGPPQSNWYPTSIWAAGEQIEDMHVLRLPKELMAGIYQINVGLYSLNTGNRLPVHRRDGTRWQDDSVVLAPLQIRGGE